MSKEGMRAPSARAPDARPTHARDAAGLLHVAVREELEQALARPGAVTALLGEKADGEARIGGDRMLLLIAAHEAQHCPVLLGQGDTLLAGDRFGELLAPVGGIDQIAFVVEIHGGESGSEKKTFYALARRR
jgi:hypothetical protein